jgi:predicted helicase
MASEDKEPNLNKELLKTLSGAFKKEPKPEEIFHYIYATLYSNTYRVKYAEFLQSDFPRIPFTKDYEIFKEMAGLGKELAELHLLKSKKLDKSSAKFPVKDGCKVEKREYEAKEEKIYINDKQYFSGITKEVWNYYIGGYQVLDKWLKERQDKVLSDDDIAHFLKVIAALSHTIELQNEIDKLYPKTERV